MVVLYMSLYRYIWWPRRSELGKDGGLDVLYMCLYRHDESL